jgi:hypothetical protein
MMRIMNRRSVFGWRRCRTQTSEPLATAPMVSMLIDAGDAGDEFDVLIEPEGMSYSFPSAGRLLLTFRGRAEMIFELSRGPSHITIWRPSDTEVWAAVMGDAAPTQIGGFAANPAPWLDSRAPDAGPAPWTEIHHLPLPEPGP